MSRPDAPVPQRLGEVASTQDEAVRRLRAGESAPFVLTARAQTAGRGRMGRRFASPSAGLYLTYAHRTSLPFARRTWIPHVAGLAALAAVDQVCGDSAAGAAAEPVALGLKWPNDLHTTDGRKLGGILVEGHGAEHVLIGVGLNVRGPVRDADGGPVPGTAWLRGPGGLRPAPAPGGATGALTGAADPDAADAMVALLGRALAATLHAELATLESAGGDADASGLADRYSMTCLTLGRVVRVDPLGVDAPAGESSAAVHGTARAIDAHGGLVVDLAGGGRRSVGVGDVRHLRADDPVGPDPHAAPRTGRHDRQDQRDQTAEHEEDWTR